MTFSFQYPELWLILLPAAFAIYRAYWDPKEFRPAVPLPQSSRLNSLEPDNATLFLKSVPPALVTAALLFMIGALARPQRIQAMPPAGREGSDIMMVLDTSGSMAALDFRPRNRMDAAKEAARDFIRRRRTDRLGVVVFSETAQMQCPLTTDYSAVLDFLDLVDIGMLKSNGTAIGDGLISGINHLKDSKSQSKTIILLTDGRNTAGEIDPLTAAQVAQTEGIKVYTIGTAVKGPAMIPHNDPVFGKREIQIPDELDEGTLIGIARMTGGEYFRATSLKELYGIYEEIDKLETPPVNMPVRYHRTDLYAMFLIPALLLLAGEFLLGRTWLLTLP